MRRESYLIDLHDALTAEFFAAFSSVPDEIIRLKELKRFADQDINDSARVVVCIEDAATLDLSWLRCLKTQNPSVGVLVLSRRCTSRIERRLLLNGALQVLCSPFERLDFEEETTGEPTLSQLFLRQPATAMHGHIDFRYQLPSHEKHVTGMIHTLALLAMEFGFSSRDYMMNLPLVLDEAITNAIVHGNAGDPDLQVEITGSVTYRQVVLSITDHGKGFNWRKRKNPLAPENLMSSGGRGLFLIESIMDSVKWSEDGRRIEMRLTRPDTAAASTPSR